MSNKDVNINGKVQHSNQLADVEYGKQTGEVNDLPGKRKNVTTSRRIPKARPVRVLIRHLVVMAVVLAALVGCGAIVGYYLGWIFLVQLAIVALVAYLAAGKWRWCYVALRTLPRDIRALLKYIKLLIQIRRFSKQNVTLADLFQQNVKKHPNKPCILFEDQVWTFAQVEEYSNKIANTFKSHGYKKGDKVALFLENKPEFICIWLGLSKLGVIIPLINTNLRLIPLVHSVTVAKCQAIIFGTELSDAVVEILDKIESTMALYQINCNNNQTSTDQKFHNLHILLKDAPSTPPQITEKLGHHDCIVYIYTSGTTGLPKAAVINASRYIFIAAAMHCLCDFSPSDTFYTPLPLYHTAGGCMTVGQMIIYGSTIVIRKKFSASGYFDDCRKYKCTAAQYIGEMCRYILATPPKDTDNQHNVRLIYGNGLRPQIWTEFVERFNIRHIKEFYGATEGNANIVNIDNTVGAIGFVSRIIPSVYPIAIIKVDAFTGEPIRNARGYVDQEASKKKIVHDVFTLGDSAFLSGDILVADELGNLFFKDRTGDTFRWKGENVSTSEVEAIISNLVGYKDAVVYGTEIRGQEGRAGMVAILDPDGGVDLKKLIEGLRKTLPSYARPIFVRILKKLDMTGTYKLKKNDLQEEGFDPSKISDSIYYLNGSTGVYDKLTPEIYNGINNGFVRV
ncbi:hypothetical protein JTB14_020498 [Gonioctena quinquepunctata]|nr:hypothetical protein JTB14_020498 [Gonioctena quinquepunctata]